MGKRYEQIDTFQPWAGDDFRPIAVLDLEPVDLEARLGIVFDNDTDDLDDFTWAGLKLTTGEQILLTRHRRSPGTGTQVDTDLGADTNQVLERFLDATGILMAEVKWRAPSRTAN